MEAARKLVATLPRPLLTFFSKHPPLPATGAATGNVASSGGAAAAAAGAGAGAGGRNPFVGFKSAKTGRWHEPSYSVRRAQQLYSMAREFGVESMLPARSLHKRPAVGEAGEPGMERSVMKGLVRWKGTKSERTFGDRKEAIQLKLADAKDVMRGRRRAKKNKLRVAAKLR